MKRRKRGRRDSLPFPYAQVWRGGRDAERERERFHNFNL